MAALTSAFSLFLLLPPPRPEPACPPLPGLTVLGDLSSTGGAWEFLGGVASGGPAQPSLWGTAASGVCSSLGVSGVCPHHHPTPFSSPETPSRGGREPPPNLWGVLGPRERGVRRLRPQPRMQGRVRSHLGVVSSTEVRTGGPAGCWTPGVLKEPPPPSWREKVAQGGWAWVSRDTGRAGKGGLRCQVCGVGGRFWGAEPGGEPRC